MSFLIERMSVDVSRFNLFLKGSVLALSLAFSCGLFADTNMLHIATSVATTSGMEPAVGNYAVPEAITCTAPISVDTNGIRYACTGYTLETYADGVWSLQETVADSTSFNCPADGTPRRVTWQWEATHYKVTIQLVPADSGSVTVEPALPEDGYCAKGTKLTLTATPNEGREHIGWADASKGYPEGPRSITVTAAQTIMVGMAGKWTYSGTTLANGVWSIKATKSSGVNCSLGGTIYSGFGKLDFRNLYDDAGIKITSISNSAFKDKKMMTSFFGPDVVDLAQRAFQSCSQIRDLRLSPNLKKIESFVCCDDTLLTNFEPRVGLKVSYLGNLSFRKCPITGDLSYPNATSASASGCTFEETKITSVYCPKLDSVTENIFKNCSALTNVVVKGSTIGKSCFSGCSSLKDLFLMSKTAITFTQYSLNGVPHSARIWCHSEVAPASMHKDTFYPTTSAKPYLRFYVKNGMDEAGWQKYMSRVQNPGNTGYAPLTASDKKLADYPGRTRAIGIKDKTGTTKPVWFIKWPVGQFTFFEVR